MEKTTHRIWKQFQIVKLTLKKGNNLCFLIEFLSFVSQKKKLDKTWAQWCFELNAKTSKLINYSHNNNDSMLMLSR